MANSLTRFMGSIGSGNTNNQGPPAIFASITYGWWVFIGCTGAVILAGTPVAPFVLGVMTIASLFQAEKLVTNQ